MSDKEEQTMYLYWHRNKAHSYNYDHVAALMAYWSFRYPNEEYMALKKLNSEIIGPAQAKAASHTLTKNGKPFCIGLLPTLNTIMGKLMSKGWETWAIVEGIADVGEAYQLVCDFNGKQVLFAFPTNVLFMKEVAANRGIPGFKIYVRKEG